MKIFIFSCQKYPYIKRNAERHFYSPPDEKFLFFRLIEYMKTKNTHLFQVNALSKFPYFVVYDSYPNMPAYLLKCNCQQLYFHVGMGATGPVDLCLARIEAERRHVIPIKSATRK